MQDCTEDFSFIYEGYLPPPVYLAKKLTGNLTYGGQPG